MTPERLAFTAQGTATGISVHLRVLATTDLHAHLLPFDYFTDTRAPGTGLACLAEMMAAARANAPNVVVLDNGDTLQGAPLADAAVAQIVPSGRPHPMIAAMSALGFDAATLGNHDFDFGLQHLEASLASAAFPVVSANTSRMDGSAFVPRRVILDRDLIDQAGQLHRLRIGVTGAVPPQVARWNRPHLQGKLEFSDIVSAVRTQVGLLKKEGADIVVVLAHSGCGTLEEGPKAENVALQVARISGVDAVVAGHTHRLRPEVEAAVGAEQGSGAALVQPGAFGSHLGCIDMLLRSDAANPSSWHVAQTRAANFATKMRQKAGAARPHRLLTGFPMLRADLARDHATTRAYVAQPLGQTLIPLETYFSTIAPCAATQVVADAQFAAAQPLIDGYHALNGLAIVSAVAAFKSGGRSGPQSYTDIPVGALKLRHAADLYLYPNMLSVLRITGAGIKDWLERSVSIFHRIDPSHAAPQPLIDRDFAPYNFDRIVGLTYDIDLSRSAHSNAEGDRTFDTPGRIRNLRHASGAAVSDTEEMLVITNSYRAAGGGFMQAASEAQEVLVAPFSVRDAVAEFMANAKPAVNPVVVPNFRLLPLGGVEVEFATGPGALHHPGRVSELGLTAADHGDSQGFQTFSMRL